MRPDEVEEGLLIEAISLLVQRQRETESLVAEQVFHAEERATVTERHYAELEARLTGIEDQLSRLIRELDTPQTDPAVDERMARLREQIEGLRAGPDGRPPQTGARAGVPGAQASTSSGGPIARMQRPADAATVEPRGVSIWDVLGATAQERFGLVLIVVGGLAVLYAILSQLPLR